MTKVYAIVPDESQCGTVYLLTVLRLTSRRSDRGGSEREVLPRYGPELLVQDSLECVLACIPLRSGLPLAASHCQQVDSDATPTAGPRPLP